MSGGGAAGGSMAQSGDSAAKPESGEADERAPVPSTTMMEKTAAGPGSPANPAAGSAEGAPLGESLGFGERLSLREARDRSDEPVLLPTTSGLERPDEVYANTPRTDDFTLVYGARDGLPPLEETGIGLVLTQSAGDVDAYFVDGVTSGAGIEEVGVNDATAYWATGEGGIISAAGGTESLSGNVLVWGRDDRAFRLQANVDKQEALRIAESVR